MSGCALSEIREQTSRRGRSVRRREVGKGFARSCSPRRSRGRDSSEGVQQIAQGCAALGGRCTDPLGDLSEVFGRARGRHTVERTYQQSGGDRIDRIAAPKPSEERSRLALGSAAFDRNAHHPRTTHQGFGVEGSVGFRRRPRQDCGCERTGEAGELTRSGPLRRRAALPDLDTVSGSLYEIGHDRYSFTIDSVFRHFF